jgi:hypothetical protein
MKVGGCPAEQVEREIGWALLPQANAMHLRDIVALSS